MELEENNINGEIARKRDIFLEAEREYLDELSKRPTYAKFILELNKFSASELSKEAERRINCIENGKVSVENLDRVEAEIILIYAAIQDKTRERVKEKTMEIKNSNEDELEI